MSNKGLSIVKPFFNKDVFTTEMNHTIKLEKSDSEYLGNLSDLLGGFLTKNFKIKLNRVNFENLVVNVYEGFLHKKPNTRSGGSKSEKSKVFMPRSVTLKQSATARRIASMKMVPYEGSQTKDTMEMESHGPTGMAKKSSKKSGSINKMCNNMNSYDFKVIGIFVVACILIYFGFSSLDETTRDVMGKGVLPITKELLVDNSIFDVPSTVIRLITDRITEKSMELFNTASIDIASNVAATCSTNAGIINTLFNTNTYTTCVTAQTATELAKITAQQTYYMTTTLTKTLSGVSSGLNLMYIGIALFGSSSGYIAVRLGIKKLKTNKYLTNGSSRNEGRIQELNEGGNNKKFNKSNKSNKTKKSKRTKKSKNSNKRKTRKH